MRILKIIFLVLCISAILFLISCLDNNKIPTIPINHPPIIEKFTATPDTVAPDDSVEIKVSATDPDGDSLQYSYDPAGGNITDPDDSVTLWIAPQVPDKYIITAIVSDGNLSDKDFESITVFRETIDTTEYGFEEDEMGWESNIDSTSLGIYSVEQTTEWAYLGSGSLKMKINLIGNHPNYYQGEADVDWRYFPPTGLTAPINLLGVEITAVIRIFDPEAMGPEDRIHGEKNYAQIIVKDSKWRSQCGNARKINYVDKEISIALMVSTTKPRLGTIDPGFDPKDIIMVGVKVGTEADSTYTYTGPIYLDAFDLIGIRSEGK